MPVEAMIRLSDQRDEVVDITRLRPVTIWRLERKNLFPRRIKLGDGRTAQMQFQKKSDTRRNADSDAVVATPVCMGAASQSRERLQSPHETRRPDDHNASIENVNDRCS